jgi:hypothetical protein
MSEEWGRVIEILFTCVFFFLCVLITQFPKYKSQLKTAIPLIVIKSYDYLVVFHNNFCW